MLVSVLSLLLNINIYLDDTWMRNIYLDGTWMTNIYLDGTWMTNIYLDGTWMTNIYLDGTWMTNIYLDDTPGPWQSSRCSTFGSCNQTPAKLPPGKYHQQPQCSDHIGHDQKKDNDHQGMFLKKSPHSSGQRWSRLASRGCPLGSTSWAHSRRDTSRQKHCSFIVSNNISIIVTSK